MKLGRFFLKYTPLSAAGRNAYLFLVKLNFKGSALVPYRAQKDKNSVAWKNLAKYWHKIGGNVKKLDLAIQQGMKKANAKAHKFDGPDNFEPVSTISAALAAIPVIAGVIATLKKSGVQVPDSYTEAMHHDAIKGAEKVAKTQGLKPDANGNYTIAKPPGDNDNTLLYAGAGILLFLGIMYVSKNHK